MNSYMLISAGTAEQEKELIWTREEEDVFIFIFSLPYVILL